jgi:hypothetical protein
MADNNFRSYRSRDPVAREGTDQAPRRGSSDPLAELARLIGKSDPFADPVRHDTYSDERSDARSDDAAQSPGGEWGAHDNYAEEHRPAEERYVTPPPRDELLPSFAPPPQERAYESESPSGGRFFSGAAARFNGFREDPPAFPAAIAADNIRYGDDPASPSPDDRPPVLPVRQTPAFPSAAPEERAVGEIQAAEVGEAYGADDYYDDAPRPRRRGGLVVVMAVLALAVLGTAGAFAYRAMFGGSVLPTLPPIIKAGNGPNKIVPGYGDARANNSAQTTAANPGSGEKIVSREEQPVEIQEAPKTAPRVISTIPISPNPSAGPPGVSGVGPSPFASAPTSAAPAAAPPVIATQPAQLPPPAPAPAPASAEPKKVHTVTIRSDQSGGADTAPTPQHGAARAAKMSAAKPSAPAPAPAPSGNQPLSIAPDSQGDVAPPAPAPAPTPSRSRAHASAANAAPAGGSAAETSSSGGYAVQVSSQRSEAEAHAAFRALRAKFPNQLGGREPIVRRADLGAKGIYYRAMVGPFASMEEAAGMCSNLKAAGGTCLVQRN